MFNQNSRASDTARTDLDPVQNSQDAIPLSVAIVTDDHATAQALVNACEFMRGFDCRLRVAALRDDPAQLRALPGEVLIIDAANAPDRRLDPERYPDSPCISLLHAAGGVGDAELPPAHAELLFEALSPATLELAVHTARRNCRALTTARRATETVARAALAARDAQRRILEEIGPIAHALEGLLDIVRAENGESGAATPTQFNLLRHWTSDLVLAVGRHQDAAAAPIGAQADLSAIMEDTVALFRTKSDGLGHTVVLSNPPEPVMVSADPGRLQATVRQLLESVFDREGRDRRIDIVLWRSMDESRLALVSGPPVRRGADASEASEPPPVRPAGLSDASFVGALAQLRELGAVVESSCASTFGSSLLVSLPVA